MYGCSAPRIVGVALAATLVLTPRASADVDKPAEGTGDTFEDPGGGAPNVPSTQSTNLDLTRHEVRHGKKITLKSRYTDLTKPAEGDTFGVITYVKVKGSGDEIFLSAYATHKDPDGKTLLQRRGSNVDCRGLKATLDYNDDTITTIVPRSCLGTPEWLRYHSHAHLYLRAGSQYLYDSAGTSSTSWDDLDFSGKLRKG